MKPRKETKRQFAIRIASMRAQFAASILSNPKMARPAKPRKHLIGICGNRGYFLVNNESLILDRETYKEIAAEARAEGLEQKLFVFCRLSSYTGANLEICQGAN
jgi:hypothetical protein